MMRVWVERSVLPEKKSKRSHAEKELTRPRRAEGLGEGEHIYFRRPSDEQQAIRPASQEQQVARFSQTRKLVG